MKKHRMFELIICHVFGRVYDTAEHNEQYYASTNLSFLEHQLNYAYKLLLYIFRSHIAVQL